MAIEKKGSRAVKTNTVQNTLQGVTVTAKNKKKKAKGAMEVKTSGPKASVLSAVGSKPTTSKKVMKYEEAKDKASKSGKARHYRKANRKYKRLMKK